MCIVPSPNVPDPAPPTEMAQSRLPDGDDARSTAGRRAADRARAQAGTVLTSGSGVSSFAPTERKTLLGQ